MKWVVTIPFQGADSNNLYMVIVEAKTQDTAIKEGKRYLWKDVLGGESTFQEFLEEYAPEDEDEDVRGSMYWEAVNDALNSITAVKLDQWVTSLTNNLVCICGDC